ncbi:ABC-2 type transport system ATP-binding protein [Olsenella profusa DSM 13989]|uniref:ABC transporter ATP-binding protein n=1 Tax=Olsenella profusa TaxID=138595 RepID=UPI002782370B|nr:ABC transporter ATP-binding protein [Olsenella profusa]MDP9859946.1 ABC-2 type transport system ATP-binding protein [Olsenella profusa DSM 13989]
MGADDMCQPSGPILAVEGYSKSYGRKRAVDNVSFSVLPGSIFGFVGHNGAGKTTLIRSIVGALAFDEGDIRICGKSVRTDPVACKRVCAYVPDNPDVYGFLTGMQYLDYVADLFCVGSDERVRRIDGFAKRLGMEDRLGEMVSAYSHGMRQKLVLIGAFLHEPRLLVLDEPFIGLDPEAAYELRTMMRELTSRGSAIFLSSHVLDAVEKLCDTVAIIRQGGIVRVGTTDEVRRDESLEQVFLELARETRNG